MCNIYCITLILLLPICLSRTLPGNDTEVQMESEIPKLKTQLYQLQDQLGNITRILKNGNPPSDLHVHFFARVSKSMTLNVKSIVIFDEELNDYGNNYNPGDGIFVAPVTGYYLFSITLSTASKKLILVSLRVDSALIDSVYVYSDNSGTTGTSKTVICKVKKGDHVWIQTEHLTENYFHTTSGFKSTFTGLFLHGVDL